MLLYKWHPASVEQLLDIRCALGYYATARYTGMNIKIDRRGMECTTGMHRHLANNMRTVIDQ